ncbi:MAG: hypothetical protein D6773_11890 [Alphaproteobacteria bacterium]|nr:MAG: hypothetical protein D6773_11890 [Alphaproteobacteria bacterium]
MKVFVVFLIAYSASGMGTGQMGIYATRAECERAEQISRAQHGTVKARCEALPRRFVEEKIIPHVARAVFTRAQP